MNLYVVRHGETDMGKNHIIANETEPLNANGIRQAQNLHNELEKLRIDRIYVSPIQRAKDTLFYFHLSKDIPVEIEPRIKERDMGKYAGVPFYDLDWDNFWGFHSNQKYPNCESMADTFFRVSDFINELIEKDENVLFVTHGGISRAIYWYMNGIPDNGLSSDINENCKIYKYELNKDKYPLAIDSILLILLIIIQVASRAEMIVKNGATRHAREKIGTREIIIGKLNARVNIFTWNLQFKLSI